MMILNTLIKKMTSNTIFTASLSTALLSTIFLLAITTNAFAISPYAATYSFNLDNKASGVATRVLSKQANNWAYNFEAKIPVIATANEKSVFSINNNQVVSKSYQRQYKILVHRQTTNLQFNPTTKNIDIKKDQKTSQLPWQMGVLDDLNVEIQIREDLKNGGLKSSYLIADHKDITARQFVNEGLVKVSTPMGNYDAYKVRINYAKKNKSTVFWLAPSLDYLLVKMTHNDGSSVYTLNLTKYQPKTS